MNAGAICSRNVVVVDAASTLRRSAALMRGHHVGFLATTGSGPHGSNVVGAVTDRDLVVEGMAGGADSEAIRVGENVLAGA
jgi:Predicted transcriptional regulator with C-terminal CBS domains